MATASMSAAATITTTRVSAPPAILRVTAVRPMP